MPERISLDGLLAVANKVRAAGGGNPLDALMPAVPTNSELCLVAANMNFNCTVVPDEGSWYMTLRDENIAKKISESLGWEISTRQEWIYSEGKREYYEMHLLLLPPEVGRVADDFDDAFERAKNGEDLLDSDEEMLQYIDESTREAYSLGHIVDGKLVL